MLREGVHDVQALADLLADPRLNAGWFRAELSMSMGDVVSLLHQAREKVREKVSKWVSKFHYFKQLTVPPLPTSYYLVVLLTHQARELLSLKPGGARAKRAADEFERRAADSW